MNKQLSDANNKHGIRYNNWESKYLVLKKKVNDINGDSLELDKRHPNSEMLMKWISAQRRSFKQKPDEYDLERRYKLEAIGFNFKERFHHKVTCKNLLLTYKIKQLEQIVINKETLIAEQANIISNLKKEIDVKVQEMKDHQSRTEKVFDAIRNDHKKAFQCYANNRVERDSANQLLALSNASKHPKIDNGDKANTNINICNEYDLLRANDIVPYN